MSDCPCEGCYPPKRKLGCHGFCEEYRNWKTNLDEINERRSKDYDSQFTHNKNKMSAIRKKMLKRK